jgi:hypothetical protein
MIKKYVKKFIQWYITRFWSNEVILMSAIEGKILQARNDEAERYKKDLKEEIDHCIEMKDLERNIEISALNAEVSRLQGIIDSSAEMKRTVQRQELFNKRTAQQNLTVAMEIKFMVNKLLDTIAVISGKFDTLTSKATDFVEKIDDNFNKA